MELQQIEAYITSEDAQYRMRALTALREYDPEVAVPLLQALANDPEVLVRSFVAMGLGRKQSETAFAALVQMCGDADSNIRAEAASSLALYGERSLPYLQRLFRDDRGWLVRQSILAALMEMSCPALLRELCAIALHDRDLLVRETAVDALGTLAGGAEGDRALDLLLEHRQDDDWQIRARVAYGLRKFDDPRAESALAELRQDRDHRVIATLLDATL